MSKKTDKAETTEKPDPAILRRFRREVYVALTDHEVEVYGRKLAAKKAERDTLTERAKQAAAAFKGQIADVTTEVNRLAAAINDGKELRNTDVYDRLDGSQVFTHRADNGEVIDPGTEGFVVTADGRVIAHPPYSAELLQVGIVSDIYEDEPAPWRYGSPGGPVGVC